LTGNLGMRAKRTYFVLPAGFIAALGLAGCNSILGLNQLSIGLDQPDGSMMNDAPPIGPVIDATPDGYIGECVTNAECTERATAEATDAGTLPDAADGGARVVPAICQKPEARCVQLLSEDCNDITGNYRDDDAIILGTLFSTVGAQAATNLQRQRSATLAIEQINGVGGIPAATPGGPRRPLVMVSCDEATKVMRAGAHLVNDLRVPAIVGPNTSQDTIDLSNSLTNQAGTVLMTPTAVASSIPELMDNDMTWLMVPSDKQRGRLMINQINQLETELKEARGKATIKLGIVFRNDALGQGTRSSLNDLVLNGKPLNDPVNAGSVTGNVTIDGYDFVAPNQDALVNRYVQFAPDIVVLAGTAEAITAVLNPIEQRWADAGGGRPYYVLIDSAKVPELIAAAANPDLRARVRGTGITPGPTSDSVKTAFELDYRARYGTSPTASGVGPAYDAAYAIAYAMSAIPHDAPVTGPNIAKGLRKLAGGETKVSVGVSGVLPAFSRLGAGDSISAVGTFLPLEWDDRGAVVGGTIEVWCIGYPANSAAYESSGLLYDVKKDEVYGTYTACSK